jgi:hypothetical protein
MTWKNLKQVTAWTDRIHELQWGIGREMKTYTWLSTRGKWPNSMTDMELGVGNRAEAEGGGECLARWVRTDAVPAAKRQNLYVKRRKRSNERDKRWESVVFIAFLLRKVECWMSVLWWFDGLSVFSVRPLRFCILFIFYFLEICVDLNARHLNSYRS